MPYNEKFKDEDFLNALSGLWIDTQHVASKVDCSYEEAKYRLRILSAEGKVFKRREPSGGSESFKWEWKLNQNYTEPVMNPDAMGFHFFDRGVVFDKVKFMKYATACEKVLKASGRHTKHEFTEDKVLITGLKEDSTPFIVNRVIENTNKAVKSTKKGRYIEFIYTGKEKYNIVSATCLIVLKQFFPKVKLSLGVNNEEFDQAIALAIESGSVKKVDRKKLLQDIKDVDRKQIIELVI
jgi:hypothetical protein